MSGFSEQVVRYYAKDFIYTKDIGMHHSETFILVSRKILLSILLCQSAYSGFSCVIIAFELINLPYRLIVAYAFSSCQIQNEYSKL